MKGQSNGLKISPASHPPRLSVTTSTEDDPERTELGPSRALSDDTSSELQRVAALDNADQPDRSTFQGRGALSRIVRLVVVLRDWANKGLREEEQRPDSFLERFHGPELQTVTEGDGNAQGDQENDGSKRKK